MAKTPKLALPSSKVDINLTAGSIEPAMKAAEAKSTKLFRVPVAHIKTIPGFNVRVPSPEYLAHRDTIAESIRANGYDDTKPLAGYVAKEGDANVIYVTDGHTRLDAVNTINADPDTPEEAEIKMLPVVVRSPAPSLTDLTVALHTANNGRPLTPFELGVVVKRLLRDEGADKAEIAKRLAVTPRYLDDVLLLVNGPKEVRQAVLDGNVSATLAIQELRKSPEKAVEKITAAVSKSGGKKVTKKALGPKMQKIKATVSVATDTDMKEIVKAVAAKVREAIPNDGDDESPSAAVDGTITITIEVPAAEKPKATPKKTTAKKPAAKKTEKAKVEKTAKPKSKPKAKPVEEEDDDLTADTGDEELGIPGAEEVTSDGLDDEPARVPSAVKSDKDVPADDADDI